jgi:hypothetical protein
MEGQDWYGGDGRNPIGWQAGGWEQGGVMQRKV